VAADCVKYTTANGSNSIINLRQPRWQRRQPTNLQLPQSTDRLDGNTRAFEGVPGSVRWTSGRALRHSSYITARVHSGHAVLPAAVSSVRPARPSTEPTCRALGGTRDCIIRYAKSRPVQPSIKLRYRHRFVSSAELKVIDFSAIHSTTEAPTTRLQCRR